jgi:hypothetical protein
MGNEEWLRTFVFLLKFNTSKVSEIAEKIGDDRKPWKGKDCVLLPVTGDYDMVAIAYEGTTEDALVYAAYLTKTKRYTVCSTLTGFRDDEFSYASGLVTVDPHKKG